MLQPDRSLQDNRGVRLCPERLGRGGRDAAGHMGGGERSPEKTEQYKHYGVSRMILRWFVGVFSHSSDFLVGRKLRQQEGDQGSLDPRSRVPEDAPGRPRPGHGRRLYQTGLRTAHLHRLVQFLGSSQVECASLIKAAAVVSMSSKNP